MFEWLGRLTILAVGRQEASEVEGSGICNEIPA